MKVIAGKYAALTPLILLVLLSGSVATGCSREKTFSADEFIDEVNAQSVEISLGEELSTTEAGAELHTVELAPLTGAPPGPGEEQHSPGRGSLAVYEDTAGAGDRLETCRNAADLLCYQAANVVVILEQGGIEADRLGVAMQKLAD